MSQLRMRALDSHILSAFNGVLTAANCKNKPVSLIGTRGAVVYRNKSEFPQGTLRQCPFRKIIVIGLNLGLMTSPVTDILIETLSN